MTTFIWSFKPLTIKIQATWTKLFLIFFDLQGACAATMNSHWMVRIRWDWACSNEVERSWKLALLHHLAPSIVILKRRVPAKNSGIIWTCGNSSMLSWKWRKIHLQHTESITRIRFLHHLLRLIGYISQAFFPAGTCKEHPKSNTEFYWAAHGKIHGKSIAPPVNLILESNKGN